MGERRKYVDARVYAFPAPAAAAFASSAAATAGLTFLPSFHRTRGGGARFRRPSRDRTRTTVYSQLCGLLDMLGMDAPCEWIAQDTQYAILMYNLGITYSAMQTVSKHVCSGRNEMNAPG